MHCSRRSALRAAERMVAAFGGPTSAAGAAVEGAVVAARLPITAAARGAGRCLRKGALPEFSWRGIAVSRRVRAEASAAASAASADSAASASDVSDDDTAAGKGDKRGDLRVYRPMTETVRTFLNPAHFFALLRAQGTTFFTGVPDSLLRDFCAFVTDNVSGADHVIAANEGTALAMAAGHYLATNRVPCVYLQNSGLGNTVNPLLSLCSKKVYSIPVLLIIGWRGEPGKKDEPQHLLQGKLTPGLLSEMGVPYEILPDYAEGAFEVLEKAYTVMRNERRPFALLIKKQTFDRYDLKEEQDVFSGEGMLHREEVLEKIVQLFPEEPIVTTTGFTSREMFELRVAKGQSHEQDFLTVGSMGHCSSIALGIALSRATGSKSQQQVLAIDGDGAALMHMGAFATIGKCGLSNFKHILINNAVHDSVGGQPTGGQELDFPSIALACGYRNAKVVSTVAEIEAGLRDVRDQDGPFLLEVRTLPGARADLGRPTTTTYENKEAFMEMLQGTNSSN